LRLGTTQKPVTQDTGASGGSGKYVPPSLRDRKPGITMESRRGEQTEVCAFPFDFCGADGSMSPFFVDDATIRVTNLSEDTTDSDIHELFRRFGAISRVYLARDRETNVCKGFAFVSFASRDDASRALNAINGYGYDNLILRVEWAK
jgi:translation initiation factor 3 subunit G